MDYALVVNESLERGRDLAACSHTELNVNQIHKFEFLSFGNIDGNLLSVLVFFTNIPKPKTIIMLSNILIIIVYKCFVGSISCG